MFYENISQEPLSSSSSAITSWGTASYGNPAIDVTLLIMTAVSPALWRCSSPSLYEAYWTQLDTCLQQEGLDIQVQCMDSLDARSLTLSHKAF